MAAVGTESSPSGCCRGSRLARCRSPSWREPASRGITRRNSDLAGPIKPSAAVSDGMATEVSLDLSRSAMVMIAWLVGVLLLMGRLAITQRRFRTCLQHGLSARSVDAWQSTCASCAGAPEFPRRSGSWSSMASLRRRSGELLGPRSSLPRGLAASLTADQLRWVLFHELAHVRRRDLIVVTMQRFAAVLHFFNPVLWIANRIIHQLAGIRLRRFRGRPEPRVRGRVGRSVRADLAPCGWSPPRSERGSRRLRAGFASRLFPPGSPVTGYRAADPLRAGDVVARALILLAVILLPHLRAANERLRPAPRIRPRQAATR